MADDKPKATSEIFVEYDKSGRATCKNKKCAQKLAKGCVRFAKKFEAFDRMNVQYFHPECLLRVMMPNARNWGFTAVEEIEGIDTLTKDDRDWLASMLEEVAKGTVPESWVVRGAPEGAAAGGAGGPAKKRKAPKKKKDDDDDEDEEEEEEKPKAKRARKASAKAKSATEDDDDEDGDGEGDAGDDDYDGYGGGAFESKPKAKAKSSQKAAAAKDADEGDDAAAGGAGKASKADKGTLEESMLATGPMPLEAGSLFVVTGFRDKEAQEALEARGCKVAGAVTKKTNVLVCKEAGGAMTEKVQSAQKNGIPIYTQAQLRSALGL